MSTAKRVIKNTGYLYAKMGITMFISLYTTRLVLNALGASDFGIFNIVGGAIAMLSFLNAAMTTTTQRFMSYAEGEGDKEKQKKIFNISFVLHMAIGLILGIILLLAGWFFFNGILNIPADRIFAAKVIYGSLIISMVFTVITVPYDAVLNAHENMLYYAIVGIIESFLKLGAAWAVVLYAGDKLILYGILMTCVPMITLTIMRIYCHRKYEECTIAPKKYWDKRLMNQMTSFAGWDLLTTTSSMFGVYGMGIVLNHFFGTIVNAAQGIAQQINGQLMAFSNTMLKAVSPVITKSAGNGNQFLMANTALISSKYSFLLLSFFAVPFIVETHFILKIWLKNVPLWAVIFCRLQLIRMLIEQLTTSIKTIVYTAENIKKYTIIKSVFNILPLIIAYLFFINNYPPYTIYLLAILFWGIAGGMIIFYFAKSESTISVKSFLSITLKPSFSVFLFCFIPSYVLSLIFTESFNRFLFTLFTSLTFYILGMLLLSGARQELHFLKKNNI